MNFLMTDYVYPLSEKISLYKTLNLYLDNPRTKEEIEAVSEYIGLTPFSVPATMKV